MNAHEIFASLAWATVVYLYGAWQRAEGKRIGYRDASGKAWQEGYFFKQDENKRHRLPNGRFKPLLGDGVKHT